MKALLIFRYRMNDQHYNRGTKWVIKPALSLCVLAGNDQNLFNFSSAQPADSYKRCSFPQEEYPRIVLRWKEKG